MKAFEQFLGRVIAMLFLVAVGFGLGWYGCTSYNNLPGLNTQIAELKAANVADVEEYQKQVAETEQKLAEFQGALGELKKMGKKAGEAAGDAAEKAGKKIEEAKKSVIEGAGGGSDGQ